MTFSVDNLCMTAVFNRGVQSIVSGVSFVVEPQNTLAIIGDSGSGKSMAALAISGLLPENCVASGRAELGDVDLLRMSERKLNRLRGTSLVTIPQNGADYLNPALKIRSQIYETLKKNGVHDRARLETDAIELLRRAGLSNGKTLLNRYAYELSGGMAQRVVLAMALCSDARLVLADEPTKGIDFETADMFLNEVDRNFQQACVVTITHDLKVAARCRQILVLHQGKQIEYGESAKILSKPKEEFTKLLIASQPLKAVVHA